MSLMDSLLEESAQREAASRPSPPADPIQSGDIMAWLRKQLAKFELTLKCRLDMAESWRGGTDKSWREAGCYMTKAQRIKESEKHARIADRCRLDVEMCRAVIAALTPVITP